MKWARNKAEKKALQTVQDIIHKNTTEMDRLEAEYDDKWKVRYEPSRIKNPKLPLPK